MTSQGGEGVIKQVHLLIFVLLKFLMVFLGHLLYFVLVALLECLVERFHFILPCSQCITTHDGILHPYKFASQLMLFHQ